jgi:AcrR family transcriptional regulator
MARVTRRRSYHLGDLGPRLIETATGLVRAGEEPSLRAVAAAVGVDPAAVYRHFADKADLLRAVAMVGHESLAEAMTARLEGVVDPGERFKALGEAYVRFALAEPGLFRVMFGPATVVEDAAPAGATVAAWALVHGLAILLLDRRVRYDVDSTIAAVMVRALAMVGAAQDAGGRV